jgi:two-component system, NarL family, sensor histidine kinase DevS
MNDSPDVPSLADLPVSPDRLLEESPNGWLLVDREGRISFSNARALELFGYTRDELLGQTIEMLIPTRFHSVHLQHRKDYMQHPTMRPMGLGMELTAMRKDGSEFPVEISLSPMQTPDGTFVTTIVRDIRERVRLEEERNSLRLELEMERERDRIGMDLHDGIMQEIYAAGLTLELAIGDVRERPDAAEAEIERSIEQLHEVIRNIRSYIFDLRPRQFTGSLTSALLELVREFRQNTQIEVRDDVPDLHVSVDNEAAEAAYHIVHEALSNVRKHAEASRVSMAVTLSDGHVNIEVNDNGRGFDASESLPQVHRGLRNMEVRARNAGCELLVESVPGEGTCVMVRVPARD